MKAVNYLLRVAERAGDRLVDGVYKVTVWVCIAYTAIMSALVVAWLCGAM